VYQVENNELSEMTRALENAAANLSSTSVTEPAFMQLPELAAQVGASPYNTHRTRPITRRLLAK